MTSVDITTGRNKPSYLNFTFSRNSQPIEPWFSNKRQSLMCLIQIVWIR